MLELAVVFSVSTIYETISHIIACSLCFIYLLDFILSKIVFNPVAWRKPLILLLNKDGGVFFRFLGHVVRLDYHLFLNKHLTTKLSENFGVIFVASELVVECRCIRCFHSNLSQSKHKYIRCRTSQLPKNGFLLLESIDCGYIIPSSETKLASYGSQFDQMSVSHLISALSFLMPR